MKVYECTATFFQYYRSPLTHFSMNILASNQAEALEKYKAEIINNRDEICRVFREKEFEIEEFRIEEFRNKEYTDENILNVFFKRVRIDEISINNLSITTTISR